MVSYATGKLLNVESHNRERWPTFTTGSVSREGNKSKKNSIDQLLLVGAVAKMLSWRVHEGPSKKSVISVKLKLGLDMSVKQLEATTNVTFASHDDYKQEEALP